MEHLSLTKGGYRRANCRGRTAKKCKSVKKSCKYARGTQRTFCRKRKNTRRR